MLPNKFVKHYYQTYQERMCIKLTSKQRAYLRSLASHLDAIFQIGKSGITDIFVEQINNALEARELINISVLETAPASIKTLGEEIATKTNAVLVQTIGNKITLYRARAKNSRIILLVTK